MNALDVYAEQVVEGRVPAGKYHRLACVRHLHDRSRQGSKEFPFTFDMGRVDRVVAFISKLKHYKGEWGGQFIVLQPWQVFIEGSIVGWVRPDGLRRIRMVYIEIPRKNGKTLIFAANGVYFVFFDNEPGAEGYFAAMKRDQAMIAFSDAKKMITSSGLAARLAVQVGNVHRESTSSKLQPLGANVDSLDGLNPHFVGLDEYHAQKNRDLPDVLETAMGSRRQPVMQKITTAGNNPVSPCGDEHDYACKILDGVLQDETYFAFIAHADADDDWESETTWKKANPNYGISVKPDDMRALATKATGIPAAAATFKQKRLNLWVNTASACLSIEGWKRGQSTWSPEEMNGQRCYIGVDLATYVDLCSASAVFPPTADRPTWRVIQKIWTPKATLKERAHRDRAPYELWVEQKWLTAVDGTGVNDEVVEQQIVDWRGLYDVQQVGFDRYQARRIIDRLKRTHGFAETEVIDVAQTYAGMGEACKRVKVEVLAAQIDARGCPVTAWGVSNAAEQEDGKGNVMFIKKRSRGRIDPLISITIGISMPIRHEGQMAADDPELVTA